MFRKIKSLRLKDKQKARSCPLSSVLSFYDQRFGYVLKKGSARVAEKACFLVKEKRKKIHKNCALQRTFLNLKFYNLFNAFRLSLQFRHSYKKKSLTRKFFCDII